MWKKVGFLFVSQFFGALNDNFFKLAASLLLLRSSASQGEAAEVLAYTGGLFFLPFVIFSPFAGLVADRFSKTRVLQAAKVVEVLLMAAGAYGLLTAHPELLYSCIFLMGVHTCFSSPAKYGFVPEVLDSEELSKGNGFLEAFTFAGIIAGLALSGVAMEFARGPLIWIPAAVVIGAAVLGLAAAFLLPVVPAQSPGLSLRATGFLSASKAAYGVYQSRNLTLVLCGVVFFWAYGAFFHSTFLLYGKTVLGISDGQAGTFLAVFGVALATGNIISGYVSARKVELGLVPIGAFGIAVSNLLLWMGPDTGWQLYLTIVVLGLSGGVFIVPLQAFFQEYSPGDQRGRYLALNNLASYLGMFVSNGLFYGGKDLGPRALFLLAGLLTLVLSVWAVRLLPEILLRCINLVIVHSAYRLRALDAHHVPRKGGVLLVSNHVSYVDPSLLLASLERPIRFLMLRSLTTLPLVGRVVRLMRVIPIAPEDSPSALRKSIQEARTALQSGEVVCIFAEGALSRTGQMLPFGRGIESILRGVSVPVVPVYIDRLWGSIFSHFGGRPFFKTPGRIPYPVTVQFGAPMPAGTPSFQLRQAVQLLGTRAFAARQDEYKVLPVAALKEGRRSPLRKTIFESSGRSCSIVEAFTAAAGVLRAVNAASPGSEPVGILLPPGLGGVVANVALMLRGTPAVNLNYTLSSEILDDCCVRAGVRCVITSRQFAEKVAVPQTVPLIYAEDIFREAGKLMQALRFAAFAVLPLGVLRRLYPGLSRRPSDTACIIFSSGSTAAPKGVMLTHANITSNVEGLYEVLQGPDEEHLLGVLPFFHSFGYTATLWLPLLTAMRVTYHPNPLDSKKIGEVAEAGKATILLATPTFLRSYLKRCTVENFASLKLVVVGAEKLPGALADGFLEKFGLRPLEGYGTTELSPVATFNVPNVSRFGFTQVGNKAGTVGHPLPGVAVRIVNSETFEDEPADTEGLVLITGPNVMAGYLDNPELTKSVMHGEWYITGDRGVLDSDGFLTITGRSSRFSKIGGEMVPHGRVEEEIQSIIGEQVPLFVTGIRNGEGEELVVLHQGEVRSDEVVKALRSSGRIPNLWVPDRRNFFQVAELPVLGTGKIDLKRAGELAERMVKGEGDTH